RYIHRGGRERRVKEDEGDSLIDIENVKKTKCKGYSRIVYIDCQLLTRPFSPLHSTPLHTQNRTTSLGHHSIFQTHRRIIFFSFSYSILHLNTLFHFLSPLFLFLLTSLLTQVLPPPFNLFSSSSMQKFIPKKKFSLLGIFKGDFLLSPCFGFLYFYTN
ncbi:LOW QUALITY PROTEIN: hypothetical protein TorRG33x02_139440, partial [Trema orientale]